MDQIGRVTEQDISLFILLYSLPATHIRKLNSQRPVRELDGFLNEIRILMI